jgi:hypothetical protein
MNDKQEAMFHQCEAGHYWLQNVGYGPGAWSAPSATCPWCQVAALQAENERLSALINTPHIADFLESVRTEAAHQRERWPSEHDAGKADSDWFWLVGYLAGKALSAAEFVRACEDVNEPLLVHGAYVSKQRDKALHHIITAAAALLNWHAHRTGVSTIMRPGIEPPI